MRHPPSHASLPRKVFSVLSANRMKKILEITRTGEKRVTDDCCALKYNELDDSVSGSKKKVSKQSSDIKQRRDNICDILN